MTLPTSRITITVLEYDFLRPGLELLANGLTNAKLGRFPHRHAYDRIDLSLSDIHHDRAFSSEMADRIISTRAKLFGMTATRKIRLDVFELSLAAVALRVTRSQVGDLAAATNIVIAKEYNAFARKLEKHRKRARRAAVTRLGKVGFEKTAQEWRSFNQWIRYNLVQFTCKKKTSLASMLKRRDQRRELAVMIQQAIEENKYHVLPETVLARMVRLAKESFLRGRQSMTLKELLLSERKGRDLLFNFVTARIELTPLPGAVLPPGIAAMLRAEKFQAYFEARRQQLAERSH